MAVMLDSQRQGYAERIHMMPWWAQLEAGREALSRLSI
jgi:hypothetical protein